MVSAEQVVFGKPMPAGVCFCEHGVVALQGKREPPKGVLSPWMQEFGAKAHTHTMEGALRVNEGDWIITGVAGEKYPCNPIVFESTYERIGEE